MFFHGSKHRIKNFTDEFVGARDAVNQEGPGIYFTSSWDDARSYGPYVYIVNLNPRKKVSTQIGKNAPLREIEWLIRQAPEWEENAQNWHENPSIGLKKAAKDFIEYNDSPHQQFMQVWYDFYRYSPKEYVRNMTKLGYDIIYIERNNGVIHAIVLNPSIIEFVEMKDDRTDEEKNKDGLKEIRKFIRKTLSEAFLDKQGVLQDFDFKEEYPYEDIWNLIKDYVEDNYKHWFQLGWSIFDSIIESDKYKSTNVHGSFFKVEKIDEFTNHDYPVLDMLNSLEEASKCAVDGFKNLLKDKYPDGFNGIPNELTIYRMIALEDPKDFNKNELGYSWFTNPDRVNNPDFKQQMWHLKTKNLYLITAKTPESNIDIPRSLFQRDMVWLENEVVVKDDSPNKIKVVSLDKI